MVGRLELHGLPFVLRRVSSLVVFGLLPALLVAAFLGFTFGGRTFLYDFHGDLYDAGRAISNGTSPYQPAFLDHLAALERSGKSPSTTFAVPVYPAPALLVAFPLTLLPYRLAGLIFTALAVAAMLVGLWLLGARDWRCYGAAFLSWPLLHSIRLGQVNEFLVLGCGVAWRWRDDVVAPALSIGSVLAAKLFLWPIGVLQVLARRFRVAALAVVVATLGALAAWAVIGFADMTAYPRMLSDLSSVVAGAGVSLISLGRTVGVSRTISEAVALAIALGLLGLALGFIRRPGGDRRAFGLAVMASLIASPVVWPHYLTLVFVPVALVSPTLSLLWLVPLIAYLAPTEQTNGDVWKIVPYLAIELITIAAVCFWRRSDAETGPAGEAVSAEPQRRVGIASQPAGRASG